MSSYNRFACGQHTEFSHLDSQRFMYACGALGTLRYIRCTVHFIYSMRASRPTPTPLSLSLPFSLFISLMSSITPTTPYNDLQMQSEFSLSYRTIETIIYNMLAIYTGTNKSNWMICSKHTHTNNMLLRLCAIIIIGMLTGNYSKMMCTMDRV